MFLQDNIKEVLLFPAMRPNEGREEEAKEAEPTPQTIAGGMTPAKKPDDVSSAALEATRKDVDARLKWSAGATATVHSYTTQVVRTSFILKSLAGLNETSSPSLVLGCSGRRNEHVHESAIQAGCWQA